MIDTIPSVLYVQKIIGMHIGNGDRMSELKESALAEMLQHCLSINGQSREADAFERWFVEPLKRFSVDQTDVSGARKNLPSLLKRARLNPTVTAIDPRGSKGKTVVVISLDELARTLGAIAAEVEDTQAARGGDPMKMFIAVDQYPEVKKHDGLLERLPPATRQELDLQHLRL